MQKNKIFIGFLILFIFFLFSSSSLFAKTKNKKKQEQWYGILTLESYPIKSCKVTKVGENLTIYGFYRGGQVWDSDYKNNHNSNIKNGLSKGSYLEDYYEDFFTKISYPNQKGDIIYETKKMVQNEGYNALLGAKLMFDNNLKYWEKRIIYNGSIGSGFGYFFLYGTPVTIKCPNR